MAASGGICSELQAGKTRPLAARNGVRRVQWPSTVTFAHSAGSGSSPETGCR